MALLAGLHDLRYRFISEQIPAFRVKDFAALEKNDPVNVGRVDVQRAGLTSLAEHLDDAGKIEMRKAAAQRPSPHSTASAWAGSRLAG